jgi:HEAT repeat protein
MLKSMVKSINNHKQVNGLAMLVCGVVFPLLVNCPSQASSIYTKTNSLGIITEFSFRAPEIPQNFFRNPRPQENIETEKLIRQLQPGVADLVIKLQDPDKNIRRHGIARLGLAKATEAIPYLRQALKDPEKDVRHSAAVAIGWIGQPGKNAIDDLRTALKDPEKDVRRSAAVALASMGIEAVNAVEDLRAALNDSDEGVRRSASYALQVITGEGLKMF